jgi:ADP-ribose pyrophosphatase YjhB (NUDIX family)
MHILLSREEKVSVLSHFWQMRLLSIEFQRMSKIILQVGVKILLQKEAGKYLLLRRSLTKYPDIIGRWDIVGGRINPGTSLLENLRREIQEETGLTLVGEPQLIAAQDIIRSADKHVVRLTYTGKAAGEVVLDTSENDAFAWYTMEELQRLKDVDMYFKELLTQKILQLNHADRAVEAAAAL